MTAKLPLRQAFNIVAVGQAGRLQYEALLLAASLRATTPALRAGCIWPNRNRAAAGRIAHPTPRCADLLEALGAEFLPFEAKRFRPSYPHGNKIEALAALPDAPFPVSGHRYADHRRSSTESTLISPGPRPRCGGGHLAARWSCMGRITRAIWKSLYDRFGLEFAAR